MNFIQKVFKTKESRNAGWIIVGKIIQILLSFFVNVLTARYLGPGNYGLIDYGAAYVAFFASLCNLGLNYIMVKELIDNPESQGKTIGTILGLKFLSSIMSILIIVCLVFFIDNNEETTILVTALCSLSLFFRIFETFNYWFQSKYKSKVSAAAILFAYFVVSLYRIILLILEKDVKWFAIANAVDYLCLSLFLYVAYKYYGGQPLAFSIDTGKKLLSKSYHYIVSGTMIAIYNYTDKLMLKQLLDESHVGYYSLATSINNTWVFVLAAIIDSLYPTIVKLYKENREQFNYKNRQLYAIIIYISMFVGLLLFVFGEHLIFFLFGEAYLPAVWPLSIVCWYTTFVYLGVARNAWIVCENKQRYLKYLYFSAAVINVILNYLLIPRWGACGAAVASLVTQLCTSILLPYCIKEIRPNVILMLEAFLLKGVWR